MDWIKFVKVFKDKWREIIALLKTNRPQHILRTHLSLIFFVFYPPSRKNAKTLFNEAVNKTVLLHSEGTATESDICENIKQFWFSIYNGGLWEI